MPYQSPNYPPTPESGFMNDLIIDWLHCYPKTTCPWIPFILKSNVPLVCSQLCKVLVSQHVFSEKKQCELLVLSLLGIFLQVIMQHINEGVGVLMEQLCISTQENMLIK